MGRPVISFRNTKKIIVKHKRRNLTYGRVGFKRFTAVQKFD